MRRLAVLCLTLVASVAPGATHPMQLGPAEFYWLMDRACVAGDELSVAILLKAGADPSGPRDYDAFLKKYNKPWEPSWHLIQASHGGQTAVVRLLLAAGADPNLAEGEGVTALTVAAEKGYLEITQLLLEAGADRNYRTPYGTAAELAMRNGHFEVADAIRSKP